MNSKNVYHYIALALLYVLPLLLSGVLYVDDMGRAYRGFGWEADGRSIASAVVFALSFGNGILSAFPFSTIISSLIFLYSGYLLTDKLFKLEGILKVLLSSFLLTSPFLLENLAYRYDSLPMALSVLCVAFPFRFLSRKFFVPLAAFGVFLSLGMYQISAIVFSSFGLVFMMSKALDHKYLEMVKDGVKIAFAFILGYALYTLFIMYLGTQLNRVGFISPSLDSLPIITNRVRKYRDIFTSLYDSGYYYIFWPLLIAFFYGIISSFSKEGFKHLFSLSAFVVLLALLIVSSMMPNLVISTAWITARTFIAFPLISFSLILYIYKSRATLNSKITIIICSASIWLSFFLCSQFASVLKSNDEYNNYVALSLNSVLSTDLSGETKNVAVAGSSHGGRSGILIYSRVPFMETIAPQYISQGWGWGGVYLTKYSYFNWMHNWKSIIEKRCDADVVFDGGDFLIRRFDGTSNYVLDFIKKGCN
ncbi:glucosyltransferase domain-containing protein [Escherichia coli]|nr:glucosyltransferase domain-containing protein [Escherichia coli]